MVGGGKRKKAGTGRWLDALCAQCPMTFPRRVDFCEKGAQSAHAHTSTLKKTRGLFFFFFFLACQSLGRPK